MYIAKEKAAALQESINTGNVPNFLSSQYPPKAPMHIITANCMPKPAIKIWSCFDIIFCPGPAKQSLISIILSF